MPWMRSNGNSEGFNSWFKKEFASRSQQLHHFMEIFINVRDISTRYNAFDNPFPSQPELTPTEKKLLN